MKKRKASSSVIDLFNHETKKENTERKNRLTRHVTIGPPTLCLGCYSDQDVKDVDVLVEGSDIPNRTRLCIECRKKNNVVFTRG